MKRLAAILVWLSLFSAPLALRAAPCAMPGETGSPVMKCRGACCATMKCCAPQTSPARPVQTTINSDNRTGPQAAVAPAVQFPFGSQFPFRFDRVPFASLHWQRHSISPLAASCIYLI